MLSEDGGPDGDPPVEISNRIPGCGHGSSPRREICLAKHRLAKAVMTGCGEAEALLTYSDSSSSPNAGCGEKTILITSVAYSPEELHFLRRVLDEAVNRLPLALRTPESRSRIARRLLACAATGERSPVELRIASLADFQDVAKAAA